MPLMRYQIRNEYGSADTELFVAVDRDDPEALFEGFSMAGLVGVLRQLGDLAEFAAETFCCLHKELMETAARGHGLMTRLQHLEAKCPPIEKVVLSQIDHSFLLVNPGLDWHSYLQAEENLIKCGDLPPFIMDSYKECHDPPRLFLLDKFDVAGPGSCLKRYSDPSMFKTQKESDLEASKIHIVNKSRKLKEKGSQELNGKTSALASNAKLHQLFMMDHVESGNRDPDFHVKLKRRQLNGSPMNSSSGRSYMERFVKSPSPEIETGSESLSKLKFHALRSDDVSDSGASDKSCQAVETGVTVCNTQETLPNPSVVYSNGENDEKELDMEGHIYSDAAETHIEVPPWLFNVLLQEEEEEEEEGPNSFCTDLPSSLPESKPPNSSTSVETSADVSVSAGMEETPFKLSSCENPQDLSKYPEDRNEYLFEIPRAPQEVEESKTEANTDDINPATYFGGETESVISFSVLMDDQLSSLINQDTEVLTPERVSSEIDAFISAAEDNFESDKALLTQDLCLANSFEDLSLDLLTANDTIEEEYETSFQNTHSMTTKMLNHTSTSSSHKDQSGNSDLAERTSLSEHEIMQTVASVADDGDHKKTVQETDFRMSVLSDSCGYKHETLLDNHKVGPSIDTTASLGESLPYNDDIDLHGSSLEEPATGSSNSCPERDTESLSQASLLQNGEKTLVSVLSEVEFLLDTHKEGSRSLNDHCSNPMDHIDQEKCLDTSNETQTEMKFTPPLPPLPPTKWWKGEETLNGLVERTETPFLSPISATREIEHFKNSLRQHSDPHPVMLMSQRTSVEQNHEIGLQKPGGDTRILDAFKSSQSPFENIVTDKHGRSMVRKASEQGRAALGPRVNGQDSLLEIIRNKSFNLKPAVSPQRPNIQAVPLANLRIAAILDKVKSLRQAMAGSEEDDNDSDNWSDDT